MSRQAARLVLPRGLIFLAAIWLVASWIVNLGLRQPVQPSAQSYTPGIGMMMISAAFGLVVAWPLLRLSQSRMVSPLRQTLLDLIVLLSMTQVVVWPLRLVTAWSVARTTAIDMTLIAWSVLAAAIVAAVVGTGSALLRALGMATCLAMCLLGPALSWAASAAGVSVGDFSVLSVIIQIGELTDGRAPAVSTQMWAEIGMIAAAGLAAWLMLGLWRVFQSSGRGAGKTASAPLN